jgi:hypothetical protein
VTLFLPAATDCPLAVVNVGHEINNTPPANPPSPRKIVSLMVVVGGDCGHAVLIPTVKKASKQKSRPSGRRCSSNMLPPCCH